MSGQRTRTALRGTVATIAVVAAVTAGLAAPAGAAGPAGWIAANSVATGDQDGAAVAANRIGDVAVAWEDDRDSTAPADDTHSEIYLRLFRSGTSAYELTLSAGGTAGKNWKHVAPDVDLDDRGNAVVVWSDDPDGNGFYNVAYRVVSPAGAVTASGHANGSSAGQQLVPRVAVDPDGAPKSTTAVAFTVVWEDIPDGATVATVKAAGFTATKTKAYEVTVNAAGGSHHAPDVAVSASGEALVVWDEDTDGNGYDNVGLTRLSRATGAVVLSRRSANSLGTGRSAAPASPPTSPATSWSAGSPTTPAPTGSGSARSPPTAPLGTSRSRSRPGRRRQHRRSASTTRPAPSSGGPSVAPTRRCGRPASTPTAPGPAGCRRSR